MDGPATPDVRSDQALERYSYVPLDRDAQEIRLLKLLPASDFNAEIQIEIFHAPLVEPERAQDTRSSYEDIRRSLSEEWSLHKNLDGVYFFRNKSNSQTWWRHPDPEVDPETYRCDAVLDPYPGFEPEYEALSYTWGEVEPTTTAIVQPAADDGIQSTIEVRPNLALALRYLRLPDTSRTLWIDAICIDQSSTSERSWEVKRMGNIYRLSQRVVAWLGLGTDTSSRGLELLSSLGSRAEITKEGFALWNPDMCRLVNEAILAQEDGSPGTLPKGFSQLQDELDDVDYEAIYESLGLPWWDRLW